MVGTAVLPAFTNLLFVVARSSSAPTLIVIYQLRCVCRTWRDAIDAVATTSLEWQALLIAHKVAAGRFSAGANFQRAFQLLICQSLPLVREYARLAKVASGPECIQAGSPTQVALIAFFQWLCRVGHLAATEWLLDGSVEINDALPRNHEMEEAFSLVPSTISHLREVAYDFWVEQSDKMAGDIAQQHQARAATEETRRKAAACFESFTRKMTRRCLFQLNNNFIRANNLPQIEAVNAKVACRLRSELGLV